MRLATGTGQYHLARGNMLREGTRLTNVTRTLCDRFGVRENVLPMSDTEVTTKVKTELGLIHYQEYLDPVQRPDPDRGCRTVFKDTS